MPLTEIESFNDFTNEVYDRTPEGLKEIYRSSQGLKELDLPSFTLPEGVSLDSLADKASETGTKIVETTTRAAESFTEGARETLTKTSDWLSDNFEAARNWVTQNKDEAEKFIRGVLTETSEVFTDPASGAVDLAEESLSAENVVKTMGLASPAFSVAPINVEKFAENVRGNQDFTISTQDLSEEEVEFLREKALEAIRDGEGMFSYETWGSTEGSILSSDAIRRSLLGDNNAKFATLIGQTAPGNVREEDGRIIVEDVYDFNPGPRSQKMREALRLREEGREEEAQRLSEEALEGLTYFGQIRVWANILGASQGEGTRFVLDLGPYPFEGDSPITSPRPRTRREERTDAVSGGGSVSSSPVTGTEPTNV